MAVVTVTVSLVYLSLSCTCTNPSTNMVENAVCMIPATAENGVVMEKQDYIAILRSQNPKYRQDDGYKCVGPASNMDPKKCSLWDSPVSILGNLPLRMKFNDGKVISGGGHDCWVE